MKIIASIPCYNEVLFLDYSIRAVYDYVDAIVLTNHAMQSSLDAGFGRTSTDGSDEIVEKWTKDKKVFLAKPTNTPKTFGELHAPSYNLARDLGATWYFHVGADEIWPSNCLKFLRGFLQNCEKKGILGLNTWMWHFAPDFWHYKDFRNPRLSFVTKDSYICEAGDAAIYPERGVYQYAGDCENLYPPGTPKHILDVNTDLPKNLRAFHYSCVGKQRVEFKVKFYQKHHNNYGDRYNEAYIKKDWNSFVKYGFKNFTGKHPDVMINHPLYNERMY